ncbi:hypothetical protein [Streptomyces yangpuensis]|uniref:hypothetical protein n=1 Tax=Streptomyces yangpuensis TaxID=1648182 RepID=UPI0037F9FBF2
MGRLLADPGAVGDADLVRGESMIGLAASLQSKALIVTCVVFILWFHVVRTNAGVFASALRLAEHMEGFVALGATFTAHGVAELLHGYGGFVRVKQVLEQIGERSRRVAILPTGAPLL